jgi:hypothetical protein
MRDLGVKKIGRVGLASARPRITLSVNAKLSVFVHCRNGFVAAVTTSINRSGDGTNGGRDHIRS